MTTGDAVTDDEVKDARRYAQWCRRISTTPTVEAILVAKRRILAPSRNGTALSAAYSSIDFTSLSDDKLATLIIDAEREQQARDDRRKAELPESFRTQAELPATFGRVSRTSRTADAFDWSALRRIVGKASRWEQGTPVEVASAAPVDP